MHQTVDVQYMQSGSEQASPVAPSKLNIMVRPPIGQARLEARTTNGHVQAAIHREVGHDTTSLQYLS
jgi:hypothetical protein